MNLRSRVLSSLLLLSMAISLPLAAFAQSSGQSYVHIHETPQPQQVSSTTGAVGLKLATVFSLLNSSDQLLQSFQIQDASFTIDNDTYKADVQQLNTPWTVVVLVDTSGNLGGFSAASDFKQARTDLANAVNGLPDAANIELMTFDNVVKTVQDFTQKKDTIATDISRLRAKTSGTSCLNEGLYQAVTKLSPAPGRKAVILLTASADDCATRTPTDVINLAKKNDVQIYAVGLDGYTVSKNDLTPFTDPSGGVAATGDQTSIGFALLNVVGIFKNQWTASATVYPSAGQQSAVLTVNLKDGTSLKSPGITFTSAQDYVPPATIHLKGKVQSTANGIVFNLDIVQAEKIRQLNVTIVSKDTGQSVLAQSLTSFSDVNTLPAVSLSAGLEYTLNVAAVDANGQVLSQDSADFTFEPPPAAVVVNDVQPPTSGQDKFQVTVKATNLSDAVKYKAWLIDPQSSAKIDGTEVTVPLGEPILIPSNKVGSGSYSVVVQALDSTDTVLAESAPFKLVYKRPSIFEQFRTWVSSSPFAIAGLTGVCCLTLLGVLGLVWFVIPKRRDQSLGVDLVMPEGGRRQPAPKPGVQTPPRPPVGKAQPPSPPAAPAAGSAAPPAAPALASPAARVSMRFPADTPFAVEMRRSPFRVGRRKDNDAALPVDNSSGVSGNHLTITYERGTYFLLDDSSKFGTTINGKPVVKGEPTQITDGDLIGLGPIVKVVFNIL